MSKGHPFSTTERELLLDLGFLNVTQRSITAPDGDHFNRVVIEHPGAVAIVALDGDEVVLIEQYRAAAGERILEIPAGKLDIAGEPAEDTARRELTEETGFTAGDLTHLTKLWTAVGFCDEQIEIFLAEDILAGQRDPIGPEEVDARVLLMPFDEALALVISGEIADAKTAVGLLLAAQARASS